MKQLTHMEFAAIRAMGIEGWEPCIFEAIHNGILVCGSIPTVSRNGKKKWPARKHMETLVVTDADIKAEYARYEAETGKCGDCYGEGKRVVGWHYIDGDKHASCQKCSETGKAQKCATAGYEAVKPCDA